MARLEPGRLAPRGLMGQMVAVLAGSFAILLATLSVTEQSEGQDVIGWAESDFTIGRLGNILPVLPFVRDDQLDAFIKTVSRCHDGYALSGQSYAAMRSTSDTQRVAARIATELRLVPEAIRVGWTKLDNDAFAYASCPQGAMKFPFEGLVISARLDNGRWLNAEVHPHEPHLGSSFVQWFRRSFGMFLLVAATAIFLHLSARTTAGGACRGRAALRRGARGRSRRGTGAARHPAHDRCV